MRKARCGSASCTNVYPTRNQRPPIAGCLCDRLSSSPLRLIVFSAVLSGVRGRPRCGLPSHRAHQGTKPGRCPIGRPHPFGACRPSRSCRTDSSLEHYGAALSSVPHFGFGGRLDLEPASAARLTRRRQSDLKHAVRDGAGQNHYGESLSYRCLPRARCDPIRVPLILLSQGLSGSRAHRMRRSRARRDEFDHVTNSRVSRPESESTASSAFTSFILHFSSFRLQSCDNRVDVVHGAAPRAAASLLQRGPQARVIRQTRIGTQIGMRRA
jgi:hypothetical protein